MSSQEVISGKLIKYSKINEEVEDTCRRIIKENQFNVPDYYKSNQEYINDLDNYVIADNIVFKICEYNNHGDLDIFKATQNPDGTINFIVSYYNGGCSFPEAIEEAIKPLNIE